MDIRQDGSPKIARTFTQRNGIYIINIQKSVGIVDDAYQADSRYRCEWRHDPVCRNKETGAEGLRSEQRQSVAECSM